jgi:hypothetical protein
MAKLCLVPLLALPLALALGGCNGMPKMPEVPKVPDVPNTSSLTSGAVPGAPGQAAPGAPAANPAAPNSKAAAAPAAPVPTTVELHSDCSKSVSVFYGEKPKFGSGTKSSVSSNSTSSAPRKGDGTLTIWIIDEKENGLASVHVEPSTKRVEIDKSCKQITAR